MKLTCSFLILLPFFASALCRAEEAPAPPLARLAAIACEFETITEQRRGETPPKTRRWRLWRSETSIETQELGQPDAEAWEREPGGRVSYYRIFHPEKRAIEYKATDLSMSKNAPDWDRLASVVSAEFIAKRLRQTGEENFLDRPAVRYEGSADGSTFEVLWLPAEQIPAHVRETRADRISTITLKEIHPLTRSPWPSGLKQEYEIIDFADLGDKESDPILQTMLRRGDRAASHDHRH